MCIHKKNIMNILGYIRNIGIRGFIKEFHFRLLNNYYEKCFSVNTGGMSRHWIWKYIMMNPFIAAEFNVPPEVNIIYFYSPFIRINS
jgi:hypothetical protein